MAKPTLVNNTLKDMQQLVGGNIEVLSLPGGCQLVCNEDGKFLTLPKTVPLKMKLEKWWMYWLEPALSVAQKAMNLLA